MSSCWVQLTTRRRAMMSSVVQIQISIPGRNEQPRLPQWRKAHSRLKLEIVSTDEVVSLENGEADISIRYVRSTPTDGPSFELTRDKFHVVAAPKLVGKSRKPLSPVEL